MVKSLYEKYRGAGVTDTTDKLVKVQKLTKGDIILETGDKVWEVQRIGTTWMVEVKYYPYNQKKMHKATYYYDTELLVRRKK